MGQPCAVLSSWAKKDAISRIDASQRKSATENNEAHLAHQRGTLSMSINRVLLTALTLALVSAPALAQDSKSTPAAGANSSVTAPKPSTTGAATTPVMAKTNLNTATAAQLDKLPKITPAQAKAIMEARGKGRFKDWNDFVERKVVPADAAAAIKDVVTF
jgi:DNA uptake protein ComE-like DNA-binding protein